MLNSALSPLGKGRAEGLLLRARVPHALWADGVARSLHYCSSIFTDDLDGCPILEGLEILIRIECIDVKACQRCFVELPNISQYIPVELQDLFLS